MPSARELAKRRDRYGARRSETAGSSPLDYGCDQMTLAAVITTDDFQTQANQKEAKRKSFQRIIDTNLVAQH